MKNIAIEKVVMDEASAVLHVKKDYDDRTQFGRHFKSRRLQDGAFWTNKGYSLLLNGASYI